MSPPDQQPGGPPELRLLDYLHRLERNSFEWRVAYLHLSKLRPHNRQDYKLRVAASEFDPLLQRYRGELFRLTDGDLVVFCRSASAAEMDEAVLRLRYLFSDDPLMSGGGAAEEAEAPDGGADGADAGAADARLCSWYDLETDYHALCFACEDMLARVEQRRRARPGYGGRPGEAPARPLDARTLARIEAGLAETDIAAMLRRQPICTVRPDEAPQVVLTEVHVAIGELAKALAPGVDPTATRWLFQHLTAALDERVLAAVAVTDVGVTGPLSLNLNVATLLAPAFIRFDDHCRAAAAAGARPEAGRDRCLIELQLTDIYAEPGTYVFARDMVRARGYLVCIDGLHVLHLPLIDRRRLGADFVKLQWSPDLLDDTGAELREGVRAAIERTGVERVILCRCGSADAVTWGQDMGIRLFQGRYIDSRLRAQRSPSIAAARRAMRTATG